MTGKQILMVVSCFIFGKTEARTIEWVTLFSFDLCRKASSIFFLNLFFRCPDDWIDAEELGKPKRK